MTSEDDAHNRLRVGGWLPPYQAFPPRVEPLTRTNVHRSSAPGDVDTSFALSVAGKHDRPGSAVVFCAAVAGLLLAGLTALQLGGDPTTPAASSEVHLPTAPVLPPLPYALPTPSSEPPASTAPGAARTRSEVRRQPIGATSPAAGPAATRKVTFCPSFTSG